VVEANREDIEAEARERQAASIPAKGQRGFQRVEQNLAPHKDDRATNAIIGKKAGSVRGCPVSQVRHPHPAHRGERSGGAPVPTPEHEPIGRLRAPLRVGSRQTSPAFLRPSSGLQTRGVPYSAIAGFPPTGGKPTCRVPGSPLRKLGNLPGCVSHLRQKLLQRSALC
jgi:hypothetical protein